MKQSEGSKGSSDASGVPEIEKHYPARRYLLVFLITFDVLCVRVSHLAFAPLPLHPGLAPRPG